MSCVLVLLMTIVVVVIVVVVVVVLSLVPLECLYPSIYIQRGEVIRKITESVTT
jgi:hypothetical protein